MDAFNDFLGYRELTRLPSKTIVEFFTNLDDIDSLVESLYALSEQEILFTSYCRFRVTKIEKSGGWDIMHLTCEGHYF